MAGDAGALGDDDSAEPAGECLGGAEVGQLAVGGEEGFLGGVLGEVEIAEDRVGAAVGQVLKSQDDFAEGGESLRWWEAGVGGDAYQSFDFFCFHSNSN